MPAPIIVPPAPVIMPMPIPMPIYGGGDGDVPMPLWAEITLWAVLGGVLAACIGLLIYMAWDLWMR